MKSPTSPQQQNISPSFRTAQIIENPQRLLNPHISRLLKNISTSLNITPSPAVNSKGGEPHLELIISANPGKLSLPKRLFSLPPLNEIYIIETPPTIYNTPKQKQHSRRNSLRSHFNVTLRRNMNNKSYNNVERATFELFI